MICYKQFKDLKLWKLMINMNGIYIKCLIFLGNQNVEIKNSNNFYL